MQEKSRIENYFLGYCFASKQPRASLLGILKNICYLDVSMEN